MKDLVLDLFNTKAIKACEADKPFWLTSGKIGAYFINAEFLYGSGEESKELLEFIDNALENHNTLPEKVFEKVLNQYNSNSIYKNTIDELIEKVKENVNLEEVDYISGGERRDWFFSNIVAYILQKPHITIFKDETALVSNYNFTETNKINDLQGKKCLHLSDLITEAASYVNLWIPAINKLNGEIKWTGTIVDRMQGGEKRLAEFGVETYPLVKVNKELFKTALQKGIITENQFNMIDKYMDNPDDTMREFLKVHPEFLTESLKGTGKTLVRVTKCINEDIYGLGDLLKNV